MAFVEDIQVVCVCSLCDAFRTMILQVLPTSTQESPQILVRWGDLEECCMHPSPDESIIQVWIQKLFHQLGYMTKPQQLNLIFPPATPSQSQMALFFLGCMQWGGGLVTLLNGFWNILRRGQWFIMKPQRKCSHFLRPSTPTPQWHSSSWTLIWSWSTLDEVFQKCGPPSRLDECKAYPIPYSLKVSVTRYVDILGSKSGSCSNFIKTSFVY